MPNEISPNQQPLRGRTVVITRSRAQSAEFAELLEKKGANVIVCPTIEIADPDSFDRLDEAIDHLYGYDWVIFTSVNGVDYFFRRMNALGRDAHELDEVKVCAIGDATAERLRQLSVHVDVVPDEFKAEGVFDSLASFVGGPTSLHGLNFLLPRASVARDYLPRALDYAGARVDVVPAYQTIVPADMNRGRVSAMLAGGADCIAFTSSSTVRNLAQLFDTRDLSGVLNGVVIACIGDITANTALEFGLTVIIQPRDFTIPALADSIANYFAQRPC